MIVVVGGGITGLAIGWELDRLGRDFVVLEASERAASMEVKVFTVGLGTEGATLDLAGQEIPVDLDEQELQQIAENRTRFARSPSVPSSRQPASR